jgi:hypothetical protein
MRTDSNNADSFGPVAFQPEFNNFQKITPAQAWSLFFTASNKDRLFGNDPKAGRFFTYSLGATVLAFALWTVFFANV